MATIIFDYDGTLHNSMYIYAPAFRYVFGLLVQDGYKEDRLISDQEISMWIGTSVKEMWDNFACELSPKQRVDYSNELTNHMFTLIENSKAQLYDGSIELLKKLKNDGHNLVFLSNCKSSYMNIHIKNFKLNQYFNAFYCGEDFEWLPKYEIFKKIKDTLQGEIIVIGDRYHDIDIALENNLISIGCLYGYAKKGELERADYLVNSVTEIYNLISNR